jgi:hypothetical protein
MLAFDMPDEPAVTFSAFVVSLATTAAFHMDEACDPAATGQPPPDFQAASHLIDLLSMLQEKTRGNLDADEAQLLEEVLYTLRLRFAQGRTDDRRIILPGES